MDINCKNCHQRRCLHSLKIHLQAKINQMNNLGEELNRTKNQIDSNVKLLDHYQGNSDGFIHE